MDLGHICVKEKEVKQEGNLKIMKNRKEKDAEKEQNRRTQKAKKSRVLQEIVSQDEYSFRIHKSN